MKAYNLTPKQGQYIAQAARERILCYNNQIRLESAKKYPDKFLIEAYSAYKTIWVEILKEIQGQYN